MAFDKMTPCVIWEGAKSDRGYGYRTYKGKLWRAHRAAWDELIGAIPKGISVLHKCDNPPCINIEHLFLGTQVDNMHDAHKKGRFRNKWKVTLENARRRRNAQLPRPNKFVKKVNKIDRLSLGN